MNAETTTAAAARSLRESANLTALHAHVRGEVSIFRASLNPYHADEIVKLVVSRDVNTLLPRVTLSLHNMPTLLIRVDRSYLTVRKRCSCGITSDGSGTPRLPAAVRRAVEKIKTPCENDAEIWVKELLTVWMKETVKIPVLERVSPGKNKPLVQEKMGREEGSEFADVGVLFERTPSPSHSPHSRSKTKRLLEKSAFSPTSPDFRSPKSRKLNHLGLDPEQMAAFKSHHTAQNEITERKMQELREFKLMPTPPTTKKKGGAVSDFSLGGMASVAGKTAGSDVSVKSSIVRPATSGKKSDSHGEEKCEKCDMFVERSPCGRRGKENIATASPLHACKSISSPGDKQKRNEEIVDSGGGFNWTVLDIDSVAEGKKTW